MKSPVKIALPLFGLSGLLALFLTGWVAFQLYEITPAPDQNLSTLAELRDSFFRVTAAIQTSFSQLNETLTLATQSKPTKTLQQFQNQREKWQQWLQEEIELARTADGMAADPNQTGPDRDENHTNQLPFLRRELFLLLTGVEEASTNYFHEADYLLNNARQRLGIERRFAEKKNKVLVWGSNVLAFAAPANNRGQFIESALAKRSRELRERQELGERMRRLHLTALLGFVGLCFLFLLELYRRKQAETRAVLREHAEQQAKLDKVSYFRGQLAQEHAHEIKQPLTAINAHLYTLQKSLTPGSAPHTDATVIRKEISRLDQIVQKFLQQARSTEAQTADLTAGEALGEVGDLMTSQLEQQAIELQFDVAGDAGFHADPQQFKQVLINLVKNAAESIARDGVITLRARTGTDPLKGDGETVTIIEVEDTGPGIPKEIQEKIFDPFFSTKPRGSGLGLAISARIIEQHGGRLEFDSRVGRGTIFRIVLPAVSTQPVT